MKELISICETLLQKLKDITKDRYYGTPLLQAEMEELEVFRDKINNLKRHRVTLQTLQQKTRKLVTELGMDTHARYLIREKYKALNLSTLAHKHYEALNRDLDDAITETTNLKKQ